MSERADTSDARWVWTAPLPWGARRDLWKQGGRRLRLGWASYDDITAELTAAGAEVQPYRIDVAGFWGYVETCGYRQMDYWEGGKARAATEKWLEHFVSVELIKPQPTEVHIDIASWHSPLPDILRERWGCRTYRQDLLYPHGVEGDRIGGDASHLPVPDGFVDGMTLHCSFEHFERDRDWQFLREAERVLRPGGRLCILPLYTNRTYSIQTDFAVWGYGKPELERDALICVAEGWGQSHGRFYNPREFARRIMSNLGRLRLTLYRVDNYLEVADDCYLKLAAVLTRE